MKKLILFLIFSGIIPLSCGCPDTKDYYSVIQEFSVTELKNFTNFHQAHDIENLDTLSFAFNVSKSEIVENRIPSNIGFTSTAIALQPCPEDQLLGWTNKIDSVIISSDSSFLQIPSGNKLNSYFLGYSWNYEQGNPTISLSSVDYALKYFNGDVEPISFPGNERLNLILKEKPLSKSSLKFSFSFYSAGKILHQVESSMISFIP